jgi:predicted aldo/keto reductase-like oxidoreductase
MGIAGAWLGSKTWAEAIPPVTGEFSAADIVTLGQTGIRTSRLACGTGTMGVNHHSNQSALGIQGLADLLFQGYDHGLRFFDSADSYGTHPHVAAALKKLPREKITVMSKSWSRDAAGMRADIDRFRKELGTDYIDILMMHCLTDDDWTEKCRPAMDAISEAQEKGIVRAHGCSCHTLGALQAAAKSPWVQIMLSRVNPIGSHMDADPATVVDTLWAGRAAGKAIVGMKILGQGDMRSRADEALKYALSLNLLHAFTIGAENRNEQLDLIKRIAAAQA